MIKYLKDTKEINDETLEVVYKNINFKIYRPIIGFTKYVVDTKFNFL